MDKNKPSSSSFTSFWTPSRTLKVALFATGLSGIVAEYILSTLATYFLGDSVKQFTLIVSVMLFSMGLGSRLSQFFKKNLIELFIACELILSVLVSFCSLLTYGIASVSEWIGIVIYTLSVLIGLLIGFEIPLVTRINENYEELRFNISSVMEKDYYGSLIGGAFFAFIGLPFIGLTYTPFILGIINFLVGILVLFTLTSLFAEKWQARLKVISLAILGVIVFGLISAKPVVRYGEQKRYKDKIIFEEQSRYQKIVMTQYKKDYWLYLNSHLQFSTFDEWLYHEPLVHPVMQFATKSESQSKKEGKLDILILGGGDGCAAREVLKYDNVNTITLVDLDPSMTKLGKESPIITKVNKNSLNNERVTVYNGDAFNFLTDSMVFYDVMIVDFPDPKTIEVNRLYTLEFYQLCYQHLRPQGIMITQAGSPYYAAKAFDCINKTMQRAGFETLPMHNQVLTMGEWGWIVGNKSLKTEDLKKVMQNIQIKDIETKWLNHDAMLQITSFGKNWKNTNNSKEDIEINTIHNPVLYRYYQDGSWYMY
ncbi:putative spermidine synthase with an N-terminal membrane domain [Bernardetia litoralis DSM 6794]|uniref:Polyamine aminopropyltransferase n=1 Tax=Bernardetia litoralis (strain ATCC 23117 / DSM 6794 / NBRC 15988 / NCIMB 1366 / Fx l1 / Sio-4) TaxID=880071 RepID=I4AH96_BERLS|nr:polyamine aminopropyltransferase [Bernardetia litoralis]AFM03331.1 putative spermidine synthase with an N-terminal membrane domain [Bernardetia litoralis DSM 6794]